MNLSCKYVVNAQCLLLSHAGGILISGQGAMAALYIKYRGSDTVSVPLYVFSIHNTRYLILIMYVEMFYMFICVKIWSVTALTRTLFDDYLNVLLYLIRNHLFSIRI